MKLLHFGLPLTLDSRELLLLLRACRCVLLAFPRVLHQKVIQVLVRRRGSASNTSRLRFALLFTYLLLFLDFAYATHWVWPESRSNVGIEAALEIVISCIDHLL